MKRVLVSNVIVAIAISLLAVPQPAAAHPTPPEVQTFVSGAGWEVYDADPANGHAHALGHSQNVCLNASNPASCPAGATLYGWAGGGWPSNLSSIPGATWMWAPGVTGATSPSFPAQFYFSREFEIDGTLLGATISISADDFAEVRVNGVPVGSVGSTTNGSASSAAQSALKTFDLTPFLVLGHNHLTIRAANGAFGCVATAYSCNPAGVVFGGSITHQH